MNFKVLGTQQTFEVDEPGYSGTFTLNDGGGCTGVVTYTPPSGPGPALTITVTAVSAGACTITATDSYGQTAPESITVN
jgi:hypothetical protein